MIAQFTTYTILYLKGNVEQTSTEHKTNSKKVYKIFKSNFVNKHMQCG